MTSPNPTSLPSNTASVAAGRLWWAGPLAAIASVVANLIVRVILVAVLNPPATFPPFQPPPIIFFTLIGTLLAAAVYAVVARLSRTPVRTFRVVAVVALVVSFLPDLALMANPAAAPFPGGTALYFGLLMVFHVVAAFVCVALLTTLTRKR